MKIKDNKLLNNLKLALFFIFFIVKNSYKFSVLIYILKKIISYIFES